MDIINKKSFGVKQMGELTFRCVCCMHEKSDFGPCPICGAEADPIQEALCLPLRYMLADRYFIGIPLRKNGESIEYLAFDTETESICRVREFYPNTVAKRNAEDENIVALAGCETVFNAYRSEFLSLWKKLRKLRGLPGLLHVNDLFEFNGTAYAVTPHYNDISLRRFLQSRPESLITWDEARILFVPIISTLTTLHAAGILHRGISPDTLYIDEDGKLRLNDFSVKALRTAKTELNPELYDGYCALEQYNPDKKQGEWTDVYALGAVLYRSLTGCIPVAAPFRAVEDTMTIPAKVAKTLPDYVIDTIIDSMQIYVNERVPNMEIMRSMIVAQMQYRFPLKPVEIIPTEAPTQPEESVTDAMQTADLPQEEEKNLDPEAEVLNSTLVPPPPEKKKRTKADNAITALLVVILVLTLVGIGFVVKYLSNYIQGEPLLPDQVTQDANATVTVPNCIGLTINEINNTPDIVNNFKLRYVFVTGSSRSYGQVAQQSLSFGDPVPVGSELLLSVSALPMPDLTGQPVVQAQSALDGYGLSYFVEYKTYSDDDKSKSGTVAYTTPSSATAIVPGENKMYAKDGNYYDVLIVVWNYGVLSSETITGNNNADPDNAPGGDIDIDLNFFGSVG